MNTRIEKSKLLAILTENRTKHRAIFEEAVDGYGKQALELLEKNLDALKKNKYYRVGVYLHAPMDQTADYDRAIKMVEMTTDTEIVLQEADFKGYVMDDWAWKQQFYTSNSMYSATAASLAQNDGTEY